MKKIKALIADDSALMRRAVIKMLSYDPRFDEPDIARDGIEVLERIKEKKYDVVSLDVEMPRQNGIETLKKIMELDEPVPVVMFSSLTQKNTSTSVQCLELGAIDVIGKPSKMMGTSLDSLKEELITKLFNASQVPLIKLKQLATMSRILTKKVEEKALEIPEKKERRTEAVLIGISTGGPQSLQSLLPKLPENIEVGMVIAQHMPPGFTKPMAERLNKYCKNLVKEAEDGEIIEPGKILVGKSGEHVTFYKKDGVYGVSIRRFPTRPYYPSVDLMFESAAETFEKKIIAIVMTGMGNDGMEGAKALKKKGKHHIIAQDEKSSVIYGMPRAIVENNLADEVVSLNNMAEAILRNL